MVCFVQQPLFAPEPAGPWRRVRDGHPVGKQLYERHYSARPNRNSKLFVGPGGKLVLITADCKALFVWREFINDDGQQGINCAVFRNEGPQLSSELLREAEAFAWARWPGRRLYTYVNPKKLQATNSNPGCCFKKAGWQLWGVNPNGLLIFEKLPL